MPWLDRPQLARLLCPLALWLAAAPADAFPRLPKTLYVGVGSVDCDYATIQDAVDNSIAGDVISITPTQSYTGQHVTISNKSIGLTGGSTCGLVVGGPAPKTAATATRLAIAGDGANPVFYITGGTVTLANLDISGGLGAANSISGGGAIGWFASGGTLTLQNLELHGNSGASGAIGAFGYGELVLDGVSIHDNVGSGAGGGIGAVSQSGGQLQIVVMDDPAQPTDISGNRARNGGGGIYAGSGIALRVVAAAPGRISIHGNAAGDPMQNVVANGGGILASGATVDIALPGATGLYANQAAFGAGIAVGATNQFNGVVRVFSTDPGLPTDIESNVSSAYGGALYVGGSGGGTYARACLFDAALTGNSAIQSGSAIHVGNGGRLSINPPGDADCDRSAIAALGAVACDPAAAACNSIRQNTSTGAAAIEYSGAALISAQRVRLTGNSGAAAIRGSSATGDGVAFSDCLLDHNTVALQLVFALGAAPAFDGCTFADDSVGGATVFAHDAGFTLTRSIVAEAKAVYDPNVAGFDVQYALFNDPKLPTDATVVYSDASFADPGAGDYHLTPGSAALDFAPAGMAGTGGDFDRQPREVDLDAVSNLFGARDLGPFEYQVDGVGDRVFLGTFD